MIDPCLPTPVRLIVQSVEPPPLLELTWNWGVKKLESARCMFLLIVVLPEPEYYVRSLIKAIYFVQSKQLIAYNYHE